MSGVPFPDRGGASWRIDIPNYQREGEEFMKAHVVCRWFAGLMLASLMMHAAVAAHDRAGVSCARACNARSMAMNVGPMEDYFNINVDGRWYQVDWSWYEAGGNYTLSVTIYLGPGGGTVEPSATGNDFGGEPIDPATRVDGRQFPMGPDGPMGCSGCDPRRVRDLIDPNGNGRPFWVDVTDHLRPNVNIQ